LFGGVRQSRCSDASLTLNHPSSGPPATFSPLRPLRRERETHVVLSRISQHGQG
jgi:hypothetical protein